MGMRVLGALAGEDMPADLMAAWAASADVVLAADRAADLLIRAGFEPHHVVGDMDSVSPSTLASPIIVHEIPDQNRSDADKLLAVAETLGHREITIAGIEGDLLDHVLASLASAARSEMEIRFALRRGIMHLIRPGSTYTAATSPGRRISLLPIIPSTGVHLAGVEWPIADAEMAMNRVVSISNRAVREAVSVYISEGLMLLFVEHTREEMPTW